MNIFSHTSPTWENLGLSLDNVVSVANHSCDPNCMIVCDGPSVYLRSLKPIKKGDELLISYFPTDNPYWRRQQLLKEKYFFDCRCTKCTLGPTLKEDKFANSLDIFEAEKWNKVMKETFGKTQPDRCSATRIGSGPVAEALANLEGLLFERDQKMTRVDDVNDTLKQQIKLLEICRDTKMFPVYREPFATLRQSIIPLFLYNGDIVPACAHAVILYLHVFPVMYPKPFHPLRFSHTWALLSLLLYTSQMFNVPRIMRLAEEGLDFGVVLFALCTELKTYLNQSHGTETDFSVIVQEKVNEVLSDLKTADPARFALAPSQVEEQMRNLQKVADLVDY